MTSLFSALPIRLMAVAATALLPLQALAQDPPEACLEVLEEPVPQSISIEKPTDEPYNPDLDAQAAVATAFETAEETGKHVLIKFGGNWCPDCQVAAAVLNTAYAKALVETCFVYVPVGVGRYDKNMDIVARFGIDTLKDQGVPTLIVADSTGAVLNAGTASQFRNARTRDPVEIIAYVKRWAPGVGRKSE